jgi:acetyl-CoA acetyltransferase
VTWEGRNKVAVVGSAFSEVGRRLDRPLGALAIEAALAAIEDAGLAVEDIDGLSNYPSPSRTGDAGVDGIDFASVNYLAHMLHLTESVTWSTSITQGTLSVSIVEAVHALLAGACTHALVFRAMHNPVGRYGAVAPDPLARGETAFTRPYGFSHTVMHFVWPYSQYLAKYGATRADMAEFVVCNRERASRVAGGVWEGRPITIEDYLDDRMIVEPLSMLDCDMPVDGCGALVLTTADRARDLRQRPAFVSGCASDATRTHGKAILTLDEMQSGQRRLADRLWATSGMRAADVDQINLYDGFSYFVWLQLEGFGFCPEGGAPDFTRSAELTCGLNPNGGALGMGRLHGSPQVIEAVRQVQGRAGIRQVPDARVSLAQVGAPRLATAALLFSGEAD